jgi:hypothetical protein
MIFSSEGVLRGDDGSDLAHADESPTPGNARLTVGADSYEIVRRESLRTSFQLLDAGSRLVYELHPGLRRGGIVGLPGGEPAAQLVKPWVGRGWRIVPKGAEPILARRTEGLLGPVVSEDGQFAPPALELSLPVATALDGDLRRLLAFSCWLIAGWESEVRRAPF